MRGRRRRAELGIGLEGDAESIASTLITKFSDMLKNLSGITAPKPTPETSDAFATKTLEVLGAADAAIQQQAKELAAEKAAREKLAGEFSTLEKKFNELTVKLESQSEVVDEALRAGTVALDDSGRLLTELESTLQQAAELVGDSTRGVDQIADAASVQSEGGRGITANVEHIARMAGEGDAITHQVSGAVVSLRELSDELNLAVGRFRFEI